MILCCICIYSTPRRLNDHESLTLEEELGLFIRGCIGNFLTFPPKMAPIITSYAFDPSLIRQLHTVTTHDNFHQPWTAPGRHKAAQHCGALPSCLSSHFSHNRHRMNLKASSERILCILISLAYRKLWPTRYCPSPWKMTRSPRTRSSPLQL